ncbi:hypothetical protein ENSA5_48030 [Enhygromyxa salina]|uniref:Uncharacterized protein n=1 Tax=Enhygromyxa salina TaxID=215803 RepID=A0A2S9XIE2_9BACT|nr:hypothetical protein [Enhygromyxa salina]PRP92622.1 hypothetical protein ENSA5_48030 [Enhygromyxa salina]
MRELIVASCLVSLVAGCKQTPEPPKKSPAAEPATKEAPSAEPLPAGVRVELANTEGRSCRRTLCVAGPGELDSVANRDLAELCRRSPGIVQRCEGERCATVWTSEQWQTGLDGMIGTLDQNEDGKVDEKDPSCSVGLAGWSTGAVIVSDALPRALAGDARVNADRAEVDRLLAIAPYFAEPGPDRAQLQIADNVRKAFIYRQTKSPAGDCSAAFEGGPWLSPAPVCGENTTCYDYDYSQKSDNLAYIGRRGSRSGNEVGHCNIVSLVAKIGLDNLARGQESYTQLVPPYSDGTHGGRELPHGPAKPDPVVVLPNEPEPD